MTRFSHLHRKKDQTKISKSNSKKRMKVFQLMKTNTKILNIFFAVLIVSLAVGYLVQINDLATKGYHIRELENKVADLKKEKSELEFEALSLQSMGSVKGKVADLNMVAAGEIDYLVVTPVAVAR